MIILILIGLAVWRLTYMLTAETGPGGIFQKLRSPFFKVVKRGPFEYLEPRNIVGEILECFYCCSVWTSGLLVGLYVITDIRPLTSWGLMGIFEYFLYTLGASAIAIFVEEWRRALTGLPAGLDKIIEELRSRTD